MAPHQVTSKTVPEVWDKLYGQRFDQKTPPPKMSRRRPRTLQQETSSLQKRLFTGMDGRSVVITHVRRHPVVTYRLSEWDGTPIKGTFYEPDVQKVQVSDDSLFRVEKVLKRKGRKVLVRWKGWPAKYDSWIPAQPRHGTNKNNAP